VRYKKLWTFFFVSERVNFFLEEFGMRFKNNATPVQPFTDPGYIRPFSFFSIIECIDF